MPIGRQSPWHSVGASISVLVLAFAFWQVPKQTQRPQPTPPPTEFSAAQVDSAAPLDSINAYANRLHFASTPQAFEGPVDFAHDSLGRGPTARIEPERGSAVLDSAALAQGRIVARIRSDSTYAPAGFGRWWTYWWVDKKGGHWRSLFIRSDSADKRRIQSEFYRQGLRYLKKHRREYRTCPKSKGAACARFMLGDGKDVSACHNCPGGWCAGPVPTGGIR